MIDEEIRPILKTLLERSKAGQVEWTTFGETPPYDDDYMVSFPRSSVNVFRKKAGVVAVAIMNSLGTVVATIDSESSPTDKPMLEELFDSAREYVFQFDETLEDLKRALASKQVIGGERNASVAEDDLPSV